MMRTLDRFVGVLSVLCFVGSTAMICINVFHRYVVLGMLRKVGREVGWVDALYEHVDTFLSPIVSTADEMPGLLLVWISFLGAYLVLRRGGHISFDMLIEKLPAIGERLVRSAVGATSAVFLAVVAWQGVRMIQVSGATEIETAEIAQGWFMLAVPVCAALMLLAVLITLRTLWLPRRGEE